MSTPPEKETSAPIKLGRSEEQFFSSKTSSLNSKYDGIQGKTASFKRCGSQDKQAIRLALTTYDQALRDGDLDLAKAAKIRFQAACDRMKGDGLS